MVPRARGHVVRRRQVMVDAVTAAAAAAAVALRVGPCVERICRVSSSTRLRYGGEVGVLGRAAPRRNRAGGV